MQLVLLRVAKLGPELYLCIQAVRIFIHSSVTDNVYVLVLALCIRWMLNMKNYLSTQIFRRKHLDNVNFVCMYVGIRTEDAYLYRHMKGYRLKCLGSLSSCSQHTNVACSYYIILVHSKGVFGPQSGCAS